MYLQLGSEVPTAPLSSDCISGAQQLTLLLTDVQVNYNLKVAMIINIIFPINKAMYAFPHHTVFYLSLEIC